MDWIYSDGGRAAAGYRGTTGDCVVRAIAIATEAPYQEVYDALNELALRERPRGKRKRSSSARGVHRPTIQRYMDSIGWSWSATMRIGSGCQVHLRSDELPAGRLVASLSRHLVAVIDGVVYDLSDPSRGGTRCVYGYWHPHRS